MSGVRISQKPHVQTLRNRLHTFVVAEIRSSADDNAIMLCTFGFVDDTWFHVARWCLCAKSRSRLKLL